MRRYDAESTKTFEGRSDSGEVNELEDLDHDDYDSDPYCEDRILLAALGRDPGRARWLRHDPEEQRGLAQFARAHAPCTECEDSWWLYTNTEALAMNVQRHSVLLRCSKCGAYYEAFPEGRAAPKRITAEVARVLFDAVE